MLFLKRLMPDMPVYQTLAYIYIIAVILSNLSSNKITMFMGHEIDGGFLFFPLTYFVNDFVTENYGFRQAKSMIITAYVLNLLFFVGFLFVVHLPAADIWPYQDSMSAIFDLSPRIFIASALAYFVGELLNSKLLTIFKVKLAGKFVYFRFLASTSIAALVENSIFYMIVFYNVVEFPVLLNMMLMQYILKLLVEAIIAPSYYFFRRS